MMSSKFLMGALVVIAAMTASVQMQTLPNFNGLQSQGQQLMNQLPNMPNLNGLTNNGLIDSIRNLPARAQQLLGQLFNGLRGIIPTLPGLGRNGENLLNPLENTLKNTMGGAQNLLNQGTKTLTDTTNSLQGTIRNAIPSSQGR